MNKHGRAESVPVAEAVIDLAARVERLTVCHRDPEAFFAERSEIADGLRRAAARVLPAGEPCGSGGARDFTRYQKFTS